MSKKILVISALISMINHLFANTYKQDSVMFPGEIPETIVIEQINNTLNNPEYSTLVQQLDEQLCPSGFTDSRGRIMYRNMVRDVVTYYRGAEEVGVSYGPWITLDMDCKKKEQQMKGCGQWIIDGHQPATGYIPNSQNGWIVGQVVSERTVSTSNTGYFYGNWLRVGGSCQHYWSTQWHAETANDVVGPLACSQPSGASIHTWSWNSETKVGTITCKAPF